MKPATNDDGAVDLAAPRVREPTAIDRRRAHDACTRTKFATFARMRALTVLVLAALSSLSCSEDECELEPQLRQRAGRGAKDCGHVPLGASADSVDQCVVEAFRSQQAFVARYDRQGTDSRVVSGLAGDAQGNVSFLLWDSDPSGGSGASPVISGGTCPNVSVDESSTRDPATSPPLMCDSEMTLVRTCG
jgi:hypothetical protein